MSVDDFPPVTPPATPLPAQSPNPAAAPSPVAAGAAPVDDPNNLATVDPGEDTAPQTIDDTAGPDDPNQRTVSAMLDEFESRLDEAERNVADLLVEKMTDVPIERDDIRLSMSGDTTRPDAAPTGSAPSEATVDTGTSGGQPVTAAVDMARTGGFDADGVWHDVLGRFARKGWSGLKHAALESVLGDAPRSHVDERGAADLHVKDPTLARRLGAAGGLVRARWGDTDHALIEVDGRDVKVPWAALDVPAPAARPAVDVNDMVDGPNPDAWHLGGPDTIVPQPGDRVFALGNGVVSDVRFDGMTDDGRWAKVTSNDQQSTMLADRTRFYATADDAIEAAHRQAFADPRSADWDQGRAPKEAAAGWRSYEVEVRTRPLPSHTSTRTQVDQLGYATDNNRPAVRARSPQEALAKVRADHKSWPTGWVREHGDDGPPTLYPVIAAEGALVNPRTGEQVRPPQTARPADLYPVEFTPPAKDDIKFGTQWGETVARYHGKVIAENIRKNPDGGYTAVNGDFLVRTPANGKTRYDAAVDALRASWDRQHPDPAAEAADNLTARQQAWDTAQAAYNDALDAAGLPRNTDTNDMARRPGSALYGDYAQFALTERNTRNTPDGTGDTNDRIPTPRPTALQRARQLAGIDTTNDLQPPTEYRPRDHARHNDADIRTGALALHQGIHGPHATDIANGVTIIDVAYDDHGTIRTPGVLAPNGAFYPSAAPDLAPDRPDFIDPHAYADGYARMVAGIDTAIRVRHAGEPDGPIYPAHTPSVDRNDMIGNGQAGATFDLPVPTPQPFGPDGQDRRYPFVDVVSPTDVRWDHRDDPDFPGETVTSTSILSQTPGGHGTEFNETTVIIHGDGDWYRWYVDGAKPTGGPLNLDWPDPDAPVPWYEDGDARSLEQAQADALAAVNRLPVIQQYPPVEMVHTVDGLARVRAAERQRDPDLARGYVRSPSAQFGRADRNDMAARPSPDPERVALYRSFDAAERDAEMQDASESLDYAEYYGATARSELAAQVARTSQAYGDDRSRWPGDSEVAVRAIEAKIATADSNAAAARQNIVDLAAAGAPGGTPAADTNDMAVRPLNVDTDLGPDDPSMHGTRFFHRGTRYDGSANIVEARPLTRDDSPGQWYLTREGVNGGPGASWVADGAEVHTSEADARAAAKAQRDANAAARAARPQPIARPADDLSVIARWASRGYQGDTNDMAGFRRVTPGEPVVMSNGQLSTPFPKVKTQAPIDRWLIANATAVVESQGDPMGLARSWAREKPGRLPQATVEELNGVIFGWGDTNDLVESPAVEAAKARYQDIAPRAQAARRAAHLRGVDPNTDPEVRRLEGAQNQAWDALDAARSADAGTAGDVNDLAVKLTSKVDTLTPEFTPALAESAARLLTAQGGYPQSPTDRYLASNVSRFVKGYSTREWVDPQFTTDRPDPDAVAVIQAWRKALVDHVDAKGGDSVTLHRGIVDKATDPFKPQRTDHWSNEYNDVTTGLEASGITSWTSVKTQAKEFGGHLVTREVPVDQLLGRFGSINGEVLVADDPLVGRAVDAWPNDVDGVPAAPFATFPARYRAANPDTPAVPDAPTAKPVDLPEPTADTPAPTAVEPSAPRSTGADLLRGYLADVRNEAPVTVVDPTPRRPETPDLPTPNTPKPGPNVLGDRVPDGPDPRDGIYRARVGTTGGVFDFETRQDRVPAAVQPLASDRREWPTQRVLRPNPNILTITTRGLDDGKPNYSFNGPKPKVAGQVSIDGPDAALYSGSVVIPVPANIRGDRAKVVNWAALAIGDGDEAVGRVAGSRTPIGNLGVLLDGPTPHGVVLIRGTMAQPFFDASSIRDALDRADNTIVSRGSARSSQEKYQGRNVFSRSLNGMKGSVDTKVLVLTADSAARWRASYEGVQADIEAAKTRRTERAAARKAARAAKQQTLAVGDTNDLVAMPPERRAAAAPGRTAWLVAKDGYLGRVGVQAGQAVQVRHVDGTYGQVDVLTDDGVRAQAVKWERFSPDAPAAAVKIDVPEATTSPAAEAKRVLAADTAARVQAAGDTGAPVEVADSYLARYGAPKGSIITVHYLDDRNAVFNVDGRQVKAGWTRFTNRTPIPDGDGWTLETPDPDTAPGDTNDMVGDDTARTILRQIGGMNVAAISGGRSTPITDANGDTIGVRLPVAAGYRVDVTLDRGSDTYTVARVFSRNGIDYPKGTQHYVYADAVGDVAYLASSFRSDPFGTPADSNDMVGQLTLGDLAPSEIKAVSDATVVMADHGWRPTDTLGGFRSPDGHVTVSRHRSSNGTMGWQAHDDRSGLFTQPATMTTTRIDSVFEWVDRNSRWHTVTPVDTTKLVDDRTLAAWATDPTVAIYPTTGMLGGDREGGSYGIIARSSDWTEIGDFATSYGTRVNTVVGRWKTPGEAEGAYADLRRRLTTLPDATPAGPSTFSRSADVKANAVRNGDWVLNAQGATVPDGGFRVEGTGTNPDGTVHLLGAQVGQDITVSPVATVSIHRPVGPGSNDRPVSPADTPTDTAVLEPAALATLDPDRLTVVRQAVERRANSAAVDTPGHAQAVSILARIDDIEADRNDMAARPMRDWNVEMTTGTGGRFVDTVKARTQHEAIQRANRSNGHYTGGRWYAIAAEPATPGAPTTVSSGDVNDMARRPPERTPLVPPASITFRNYRRGEGEWDLAAEDLPIEVSHRGRVIGEMYRNPPRLRDPDNEASGWRPDGFSFSGNVPGHLLGENRGMVKATGHGQTRYDAVNNALHNAQDALNPTAPEPTPAAAPAFRRVTWNGDPFDIDPDGDVFTPDDHDFPVDDYIADRIKAANPSGDTNDMVEPPLGVNVSPVGDSTTDPDWRFLATDGMFYGYGPTGDEALAKFLTVDRPTTTVDGIDVKTTSVRLDEHATPPKAGTAAIPDGAIRLYTWPSDDPDLSLTMSTGLNGTDDRPVWAQKFPPVADVIPYVEFYAHPGEVTPSAADRYAITGHLDSGRIVSYSTPTIDALNRYRTLSNYWTPARLRSALARYPAVSPEYKALAARLAELGEPLTAPVDTNDFRPFDLVRRAPEVDPHALAALAATGVPNGDGRVLTSDEIMQMSPSELRALDHAMTMWLARHPYGDDSGADLLDMVHVDPVDPPPTEPDRPAPAAPRPRVVRGTGRRAPFPLRTPIAAGLDDGDDIVDIPLPPL